MNRRDLITFIANKVCQKRDLYIKQNNKMPNVIIVGDYVYNVLNENLNNIMQLNSKIDSFYNMKLVLCGMLEPNAIIVGETEYIPMEVYEA